MYSRPWETTVEYVQHDVLSHNKNPTYRDKGLLAYAKKKLEKQGIISPLIFNTLIGVKCICGNPALFEHPHICFDCMRNKHRKCSLGEENLYFVNDTFVCTSHINIRNISIKFKCLSDNCILPSIEDMRKVIISTYSIKLFLLKDELIEDIVVYIAKLLIKICDLQNLYLI